MMNQALQELVQEQHQPSNDEVHVIRNQASNKSLSGTLYIETITKNKLRCESCEKKPHLELRTWAPAC